MLASKAGCQYVEPPAGCNTDQFAMPLSNSPFCSRFTPLFGSVVRLYVSIDCNPNSVQNPGAYFQHGAHEQRRSVGVSIYHGVVFPAEYHKQPPAPADKQRFIMLNRTMFL